MGRICLIDGCKSEYYPDCGLSYHSMETISPAAQEDSSGANRSGSFRSDDSRDSSPRRESGRGSPPPDCAICLGTCTNKSFTYSCLHQFCFECLLTWIKVKAECPLCKQNIRSIIHNVRSNDQYEEYMVEQRHTEETTGRIDIDNLTNAMRTTLTLPRRHTIAIRQTPPGCRRRRVYTQNLWSRPMSDFSGRFRDCTPEFYRYNDTQIHRLVPWINRELNYLLNENVGDISSVMTRILELLPQYHISSPEFREAMLRYFGERTDHFLHELYCFASTPYDIVGYDRNVQYVTDRTSAMVNGVISSSELSPPEPTRPPPELSPPELSQPGPTRPPPELSPPGPTRPPPELSQPGPTRSPPELSQPGPTRWPPGWSRSTCRRRSVYTQNLWSRPMSDFSGRFRDCTPEFYRYNDTQVHRLVPWINRELDYLLNKNVGDISSVMTRILELLPQYHISSPEFREAMLRYFGERTDHFLHELYCFASTPYDIVGYDCNVKYATDRTSAMVNDVISSSELSTPEPTRPPPELSPPELSLPDPTRPPPELSPSELSLPDPTRPPPELSPPGPTRPPPELSQPGPTRSPPELSQPGPTRSPPELSQPGPTRWPPRWSRFTGRRRRSVYTQNLWSRPMSDFSGRFRDCTPEFYRYNDTQVHRLVPWINRELDYLLNKNVGDISSVMTRILELLPQYHISSPEFREAMLRYFGERTDHFLHELYCFASTPYDIVGYDCNVKYATDRTSAMVNDVISSSELSPPEPTRPPPELSPPELSLPDPTRPPPELSPSELSLPDPTRPPPELSPPGPTRPPPELSQPGPTRSPPELSQPGPTRSPPELSQPGPTRWPPGWSRSTCRRRSVYTQNLWSRPMSDFSGRFRDCTPEFYRYNDTQVHRLVPWINRELDYLLNKNVGDISSVMTRILELLPQYHISSPEFREAMLRYFGERTDHFLHELYCFASTPYDIVGYDRNVKYATDRISAMVNDVISSSESDANLDLVSSSEHAETPSGPSAK